MSTCGNVVEACVCGLPGEHAAVVPHVCECGGSWVWLPHRPGRFLVVSWPRGSILGGIAPIDGQPDYADWKAAYDEHVAGQLDVIDAEATLREERLELEGPEPVDG